MFDANKKEPGREWRSVPAELITNDEAEWKRPDSPYVFFHDRIKGMVFIRRD